MRRVINRVKTHPEVVGIPVLALIVVAGVILGFQVRTRLSPSLTLSPGNPEATIKLSDHDLNSRPLPNSLTEGTRADFDNPAVVDLPRDAAGNVPNLFRIQGEIIYR